MCFYMPQCLFACRWSDLRSYEDSICCHITASRTTKCSNAEAVTACSSSNGHWVVAPNHQDCVLQKMWKLFLYKHVNITVIPKRSLDHQRWKHKTTRSILTDGKHLNEEHEELIKWWATSDEENLVKKRAQRQEVKAGAWRENILVCLMSPEYLFTCRTLQC